MIGIRKNSETQFTLFLLDIFISIFAFASAIVVRKYLIDFERDFILIFESYLIFFIITLLVWIMLFSFHKPMPNLPSYTFKDVINDMIKRVLFGIIIILAATFLLKDFIISRMFIFLFGVLDILFLTIEKRLFFLYKRNKYRKGKDLTNVLIVGKNKNADIVKQIMGSHIDWGINLIDFVSTDFMDAAEFVDKIKTMHIDTIIFVLDISELDKFNRKLSILQEAGIEAMLYINSVIKKQDLFVKYNSFLNMDFLIFSSNKDRNVSMYIKYLFDNILGWILFITLLPLMAFIYLLIVFFNGKPAIFKQKRIGLNGKIFTMYKFRTMKINAENEKDNLIHMNLMSGPVFKLKNDPRITFLGKILRRFSIDEIPQLLNIIKGDMSFVGPRPPLPSEVKEYKLWQRKRLSVKPGLTCTWQISGRNNIDFIQWMYMDLEYIENWSLLYDIIIILKTIPAVLFGRGSL